MAKKAVKASKAVRRRSPRARAEEQDENVKARAEEQDDTDTDDEDETPGDEARSVRDEVREDRKKARKAELDEQVEKLEKELEENVPDEGDVTLHDGKPGSGAGLKPGDWHAPKSNPGAAARVPSQPLQPESLQSHGLGILHDKDLDNPPYDVDDPEAVDESPSGTPPVVDKKAERKKAEKASAKFKQLDPDNPTIGGGGRKDATASPNRIGSRTASKADVAGGSNSGIDS